MGLPGRHARRPRGGGLPRVGRDRLGHRAADRDARRAVRAPGCASCGSMSTQTVDLGSARPQWHRAAAADGGLRRGGQQRRPQGRPPAAGARAATCTASTTASASRSRTSCGRCCGAGEGKRLDRGGGRRAAGAAGRARAARSDGRPWRAAHPGEVLATAVRVDRLLSTGRTRCRGGLAGRPLAALLADGTVGPLRSRRAFLAFPRRPGAAGRRLRRHRCWVPDSSTGGLVEIGAGTRRDQRCTSAASRRTTPPTSGHAATYLLFDQLQRVARDAGKRVRYVQNVTDVDDPLLERAVQTGEDWTALAERETQLFREDMAALRVIAPEDYIGAVEAIPDIVRCHRRAARARRRVRRRRRHLLLGRLRAGTSARSATCRSADMVRLSGERGGDPDRPGQEGSARLPALAGRAARRAGLGLRARARAARVGTSSARRSRCDHLGDDDRRPGRGRRPRLPAPRAGCRCRRP